MKVLSASLPVIMALSFAILVSSFQSCATFRPSRPVEGAETDDLLVPPAQAPDLPPAPPLPDAPPALVMGQGALSARELAAFLGDANPTSAPSFVLGLAEMYVQEAAVEGVSHDVAFAQMCLETGFLKFGGLVTVDMHNYCGLGSLGPGAPGERFPDPRIGVRAHVQHLKGYGSTEPLEGVLVDPRYRWIKYGSARDIADLSGRWAADREYGAKIARMLDRLYAFARSLRSTRRSRIGRSRAGRGCRHAARECPRHRAWTPDRGFPRPD